MDRSDERLSSAGDVERYEALRARALSGDISGWRLGLAVLQRQGVVTWLRLGQALAAPPPNRTTDDIGVGADALVGVLSAMALACLGGS